MHDFLQLESTQETNSVDVKFLKINCLKTSWSETNEPLTAFPLLNKISPEHYVQKLHFEKLLPKDWIRFLEKNKL